SANPGIHEECVDPPESLADLAHGPVDLRKPRHVRPDSHRVWPDLALCALQRRLVPPGDDDGGPFPSERPGRRETDAAAPAGNHGDLLLESFHGSAPLPCGACQLMRSCPRTIRHASTGAR